MLRLCHISDTHGKFITPLLWGQYDIIVHSGDFAPDNSAMFAGDKALAGTIQLQWLKDNISIMKTWLNGKPFFFIPGNHDYADPNMIEAILRENGIDAINLTNKITTYRYVNFYGFPYVPYINGMFNWECEKPDMRREVDKIIRALNESYVDVLVCHAPINGTLDAGFGSTVIADGLDYKLNEGTLPRYYLNGHIHHCRGITTRNGMVVSNAATGSHIIEV